MTQPAVFTFVTLGVAAQDVDGLAADPLLAAAAAVSFHDLVVYHDTADLALRAAGVVLATRCSDGRWWQRLERYGGGQWVEEQEIESRHPDRTKLPLAQSRILHRLDAGALREVFQVDRRGWRRTLAETAGEALELVFVQGRMQSGGRREPVCELWLEGQANGLYALALRLTGGRPLRLLEPLVDRGYGLHAAALARHRKAEPPAMAADASAEDAFVAIAGACLAHGYANLAAARAGQVEGVHQMRVAMRRLRSCLRLFRPLIPREASAALVEDIRWLSGVLGPVRDWDVFMGEGVEAMRQAFPGRRGLAVLHRKAQALRQAHCAALGRCLDDVRLCRMYLSAGAWLAERGWGQALSPVQRREIQTPALAFAVAVLKKNHRRVIRGGEAFARLSAGERHALRIRIKRLRYGVEFLASLFADPPAAAAYAKALAGLQDCLGVMNDAAVAGRLLDEAGLHRATATRKLIDGWYAGRQSQQEAEFATAWAKFRHCRRPWK
ncbi:MAG: CHAD domain-containing protein [Pseudomonadota bacterium]|nr:CHAD domain-containing protein [Pseudomonadota bacterium]